MNPALKVKALPDLISECVSPRVRLVAKFGRDLSLALAPTRIYGRLVERNVKVRAIVLLASQGCYPSRARTAHRFFNVTLLYPRPLNFQHIDSPQPKRFSVKSCTRPTSKVTLRSAGDRDCDCAVIEKTSVCRSWLIRLRT